MSYNKLKSLVANVEAVKTALQIHIQGRQVDILNKLTPYGLFQLTPIDNL